MGSNVLMQKLVFVAQLASQAVLYVLLALSVIFFKRTEPSFAKVL